MPLFRKSSNGNDKKKSVAKKVMTPFNTPLNNKPKDSSVPQKLQSE
jgi:hypothetical protein